MNHLMMGGDPLKIGMDIILEPNSGYQFSDREHGISGMVRSKAEYPVEISVRVKRHYPKGNISSDWAKYMGESPCKHNNHGDCEACNDEDEAYYHGEFDD